MLDGFGTALHKGTQRMFFTEKDGASGAVLPSENGRRPSVMIVGPDHSVHNQVKQYLIDDGYRVYHEQLGRLAVEEVRELQPDIVLVDTRLPDISLVEVCKRLSVGPDSVHIPVLLIAESEDEEIRLAGLQAGGVDYIALPCPQEELLMRVATHMRLRTTIRAVEEHNTKLQELLAERTKELILSERRASIGMFVEGVVHNMNNPLTCISGSIQMMQIKLQQLERLDDEKILSSIPNHSEIMNDILKRLKTIGKSSQRLIEMVASMLQRNNSDLSDKRMEIDVNEVLRREMQHFDGNLWFKHNVRHELHFSDENLPVQLVPAILAQVLQNLIQNALDAMQHVEQPVLILESSVQDTHAVVCVKDNGTGIAAEHMPYIFEPFYSTKTSIDESDQNDIVGTGLGLFICREFIEDYGGSVQMKSQAGKGAAITIRLPLVLPEKSPEMAVCSNG